MPQIKLSDYVMQFVADRGVKHVFFLPGGGAMHLNDSLGREKRIEFVCNLHEQAASIAAEAYSRVTNDMAVCLVTTGPGGTNAVTGVAGAFLDSTPVLFLSGQVKRADDKTGTGLRQLGVQEVDIISIVQSVTKYCIRVNEPESIRYHLERAYYEALDGRRGPAWIDIPLDVQAAKIETDNLKGFEPPAKAPAVSATLEREVAKTLELFAQAERPVFVAGNGIRMAGAQAEFLELIELLQVPVLTTWLGLDLLPDSHPLYVGRPGSVAPRGANFALQNSDWLISVGARLDMAMTAYAHDRFARAAKKILVDIDPSEMKKMKTTIDLAVVSDAKVFLTEALRQARKLKQRDRTAWMKRCQDWKTRYPVVTPEYSAIEDKVSTYVFSDVLSDEMAEGDILASGSSGAGIEIFLLCYKVKKGQRVFHNRGLGAMGFGLPAAIGACIASGRKRTVSVDGDGGFQMNIQELATVAQLKLPIKFFVLNNDGYSSIRTSQKRYFNALVGADGSSGMTLPDLQKVSQAFGVPSMRIHNHQELRAKIREALATPGPLVVEIMSPSDEPRMPSVTSYQRPDGTMASKPLEDLWPFLPREEFLSNMLIPPVEL